MAVIKSIGIKMKVNIIYLFISLLYACVYVQFATMYQTMSVVACTFYIPVRASLIWMTQLAKC